MITTKNVTEPVAGKGSSKKLEPGNETVTILGVKLQPNKYDKYKKDAEYLMLVLEGPDMGAGFEGFMRDKDDPSKGIHTGQTAWVKASQWAFADGTTKGGIEISKDNEILRYIKSICMQTDSMKWFDEQDGKHDTIKSFVEQFDADKPFAGKKLNVCIAGHEFKKKDSNYLAWDLHLPKYSGKDIPFEAAGTADSKLIKFNESIHIKRYVEKEVKSFSSNGTDSNPEFDLD